jgi:hypothetical protein
MIKIFTGTAISIEKEFNEWLISNPLISYNLLFSETQGNEGICSTLVVNYENEKQLEYEISASLFEYMLSAVTYYLEEKNYEVRLRIEKELLRIASKED